MKGHCLCGGVGITLPDLSEVDACHCSMCRRWGGGPLFGIHCEAEPEIDGAELLTVYPSSDWAERAFCSRCGTHVYYRLLTAGSYSVPPGLFQDRAGFTFTTQIYIDDKPDYYAFANDTRNLTEAEVLALYGSEGDDAP